MEKNSLKAYLSERYQGWDSFCDTIVIPIFGKDNYEDKRKKEVLDMQPERRHLAEATGIKSVKFCGHTYVSGEPLQFFDITVCDKVMMDRNRVNVQKIVRSVMDQYSSAFMVFHYEDEAKWEWRFSFCYKSENEDESTDRKRYTFLLGPGQSCRTAAENFMVLYDKQQNDEDIELDDLINAFNVEALSNEFFNGYKNIYEDIIEYVTGKRMVKVGNKWEEIVIHEPNEEIMCEFAFFPEPEKAVRDYVKKLMGRLVFLQFLQKKGWLGVHVNEKWGTGNANFMQELFNKTEDKKNFIDNVLEVLFNDLNTERANDLASIAVGNNIRVPYLNGGLFERDAADETHFPLPAEYIERMLFFFSCYNFTIDENDPNDAEVGVDPEMLGRIFENLLEDNKDKGAFYTPKEIVSYMCRESLIAYLQTDIDDEATKEAIRKFVANHDANELGDLANDVDQRLIDVKICDPAIGSGAFPMGLLKELFLCRTAIEGIDQSKTAEIKRYIIQNNIYGVDIERGAVDIARLRFWLSLIVDEERPQALPNLDYKIVEGNSLITTFDGQYIDLSTNIGTNGLRRFSLVNIRPEKKALQEEQKRFFVLNGDEKYRSEIAIKNHILNIIWYQLDYEKHSWEDATIGQTGLFGTTISKGRKKNAAQVVEFTQARQAVLDKCEQLISELNNESTPLQERAEIIIPFFEWQTIFSDVLDNEKSGFDIVIGNPPYIRQEKLSHSYKKLLCSIYPNYGEGTADILVYFFGLGVNILRTNGILNFITSNKFLKTKYGRTIRNTFANDVDVTSFIDFFELPVFNNASTDAGITFLIKRKPESETKYFPVKTLEKLNLTELTKGSSLRVIKNIEEWQFVKNEELSILSKLNNNSMPLYNFVNGRIYSGVKTGLNPCFMLKSDVRKAILDDCETPDEYERTDSIIKKAFRSRDIRKYNYTGPEQWLLFIPWHFPLPFDEAEEMEPKEAILESEKKMKANYPSLYRYLCAHREDLAGRNQDETGIRYEWYALQRWGAKYYKEFDEEKLIYIHTAKKHEFYYDTEKHYVNNSCYIIASKSKFLYFFLNSSLFDYFKRIKFVAYGDGAEEGRCKLDGNKMATVPVMQNVDEKPFEDAYHSLQNEICLNNMEKINEIESKIDRYIYHLYNLSYDEVLIINPLFEFSRKEYEQENINKILFVRFD